MYTWLCFKKSKTGMKKVKWLLAVMLSMFLTHPIKLLAQNEEKEQVIQKMKTELTQKKQEYAQKRAAFNRERTSLPENIRTKRQAELDEVQKELWQAEKDIISYKRDGGKGNVSNDQAPESPDNAPKSTPTQKQIDLQSLPHKTYSGNFGYNQGKATYTYIETDDGDRIYDGKWTYKDGMANVSFTAEGQYKNDIRVGKWVWTYTITNKNDKEITTQTFNFDETGNLHGDVIYHNSKHAKLRYTIHYSHGVLIGKYTDMWDGLKIGTYNIEFDNDGKPVGTAVFKQANGPLTYYTKYENGEVTERFIRDHETGDKKSGGIDVRYNFMSYISEPILCPPATWLRSFHISPARKGPNIFSER